MNSNYLNKCEKYKEKTLNLQRGGYRDNNYTHDGGFNWKFWKKNPDSETTAFLVSIIGRERYEKIKHPKITISDFDNKNFFITHYEDNNSGEKFKILRYKKKPGYCFIVNYKKQNPYNDDYIDNFKNFVTDVDNIQNIPSNVREEFIEYKDRIRKDLSKSFKENLRLVILDVTGNINAVTYKLEDSEKALKDPTLSKDIISRINDEIDRFTKFLDKSKKDLIMLEDKQNIINSMPD
jgi:hypothetical protein